MKGAYKLLWDFLYHDCDHAGIWIVDFDIAQMYIGADMPVNKTDAIKFFNEGEIRIIEMDSGKKWFIPSFIDFQYGHLSDKNKAHSGIIKILKKYNLTDSENKVKEHLSPFEGAKEMDKEMEKVMVKENKIVPKLFKKFKDHYPHYHEDQQRDFTACLQIAYKLADSLKIDKRPEILNEKSKEILDEWEKIVVFTTSDKWYSTRSLFDINGNEWQRIIQSMNGKLKNLNNGQRTVSNDNSKF